MGKTNMVEIDISATREAVYDSGKSLAVLSEEIGRCPSYLSYAAHMCYKQKEMKVIEEEE